MRRFAIFVAASALALAGGSTALASPDDDDDYPPDEDVVLLLSSSVVEPDEEFTATLEGCTSGETVIFTVEGDTATAECVNSSASAVLTAPSVDGTYTVTGQGQTSGATSSAELVVESEDDGVGDDDGQLPATGSNSTPIVPIGTGLLVGGLGLLAVARTRRRATSA